MIAAEDLSESYPWGWLAFLLALFWGAAHLMFGVSPVRHVPMDSLSGAGEDTYLVVHMPAVPHRAGRAAETVEAWLSAMKRNGYRPALLSEVRRRLGAGEGLPPRTVVLMFDPGTRKTFSVVEPLLARHRFPAVWVTDGGAEAARDWRYLSRRMLDAMKASGRWDVGRYEKASRLVLESGGAPPADFSRDGRTWPEGGGGRRALNRGVPDGGLERLHVNWNWSEQDLIDRLGGEEPLRGRGALTCKTIQGHRWGVVKRGGADQAGFSLKAPVDGRTDNLSWLGMRFAPDARFRLDVRRLSGELWVLLRSSREEGEGLGVCFSNGALSVSVQQKGASREVFRAPAGDLAQPADFSADISLSGNVLEVSVNGRSRARLEDVPPSSSSEGIVRMKIYDKVLGAARVDIERFEAEEAVPALPGVLEP